MQARHIRRDVRPAAVSLCTRCGHARISHGRQGDDCRTCPNTDPCDGYDSNLRLALSSPALDLAAAARTLAR